MGVHLHLEDANSENIATFLDIGAEIALVGVVLYKGDYYVYKKYEVQHHEFHVIFRVVNIMEIK